MQVRKDIHQKQREEVNIAHSFDTNLKSRIHLPITIEKVSMIDWRSRVHISFTQTYFSFLLDTFFDSIRICND